MLLNYNQFYVFYLCAKHMSYKEASKILNISVPAISMQIKNLEENIGFNLFVRKGTHLSLSPKAIELLPLINETFQKAEQLADEVSLVSNSKKNKITMGLHPFLGQCFVPIFTRHVEKHFNGLTVEYIFGNPEENYEKLLAEEINIAIFPEKIQSNKVFQQAFFKSELVYAVSSSNPLAKKKTIDLKQLAKIPTIFPNEATIYEKQARNFYRENNISFENTNTFGMLIAMNFLPESDYGAFFSDFMIEKQLERKELSLLKLEKKPESTKFHLCCLKKNLEKAHIKNFLEYFKSINTYSKFKLS